MLFIIAILLPFVTFCILRRELIIGLLVDLGNWIVRRVLKMIFPYDSKAPTWPLQDDFVPLEE